MRCIQTQSTGFCKDNLDFRYRKGPNSLASSPNSTQFFLVDSAQHAPALGEVQDGKKKQNYVICHTFPTFSLGGGARGHIRRRGSGEKTCATQKRSRKKKSDVNRCPGRGDIAVSVNFYRLGEKKQPCWVRNLVLAITFRPGLRLTI